MLFQSYKYIVCVPYWNDVEATWRRCVRVVSAWNTRGVFVGTLFEVSSPLMSFDKIEREELLKSKVKNNKNRIPLSIRYYRTLPNIPKIVNRNWNILEVNTEFHGVFQSTPMIAFKCSKNLQDIIAGHTVRQGKVFKKSLFRLNGKSMPCSSTRPSLCCSQTVNT